MKCSTCRLIRVSRFAESEYQRRFECDYSLVKLTVALARLRQYISGGLVDVVAISFCRQFDEFVERLNSHEQNNTEPCEYPSEQRHLIGGKRLEFYVTEFQT